MNRTNSVGNVNNKFIDKDATQGGTVVSANDMNNFQEELCHILEDAGVALNSNDQYQLSNLINGKNLEQDNRLNNIDNAQTGQDAVLLEHENRLDTIEANKTLLNPLGWTTTLPTTTNNDKGDFYHKGVAPVAEGYYVFDGYIWIEVLYGEPNDLGDYYTKSEVDSLITNLQNQITTLNNRLITLEGKHIIPSLGTYNFSFSNLAGETKKEPLQNLVNKFAVVTNNIGANAGAVYNYTIDVAGSNLNEGDEIYLHFHAWYDTDTNPSVFTVFVGAEGGNNRLGQNGGKDNASMACELVGKFIVRKSANRLDRV